MMAHGRSTTAAAPAAVDIDWIWGRPRGYRRPSVRPDVVQRPRCLPRWLFLRT